MRVVEVTEEEAVGPRSWQREADLVTLLIGGPYQSLHRGEIPPFDVVNYVLAAGGLGGGMNGGWHWQPFTITRDEYEELVEALLARGASEHVEVPEWVTTIWEWFAWLAE